MSYGSWSTNSKIFLSLLRGKDLPFMKGQNFGLEVGLILCQIEDLAIDILHSYHKFNDLAKQKMDCGGNI